jgi:hypothetical protein
LEPIATTAHPVSDAGLHPSDDLGGIVDEDDLPEIWRDDAEANARFFRER